MQTEKRRKFIIDFLYFAILLGIAVFLCRYALGALLPFLIALLVALVLRPVIRFLRERCHIQKAVAGVVVVVLFYALIGLLLAVLGVKLFSWIKRAVQALPTLYSDTIEPLVMNLFDSIERFTERLDPSATAAYSVIADNVTKTLEEGVVTLSKRVGNGITDIAVDTPGFLLNVLITMIATIFLSVDWTQLAQFIMRQFSEEKRALLRNIKTHLALTLRRYARSYALIMFVTFAEICIGLLLIGIEKAPLIALLIAVFDILPVVGSGLILLPWTIITFVQGNVTQGIGLAVLYVVVIVVRNIMEPKIIGNQVGLHPIVTLLAMVVGTFVFGPLGLLGLPIALALTQSLNEAGVIHLYKKQDGAAPASGAADEAAAPTSADAPAAASDFAADSDPAAAKEPQPAAEPLRKNCARKKAVLAEADAPIGESDFAAGSDPAAAKEPQPAAEALRKSRARKKAVLAEVDAPAGESDFAAGSDPAAVKEPQLAAEALRKSRARKKE